MDAMRFGVRLVCTSAFALLAAITGAPMVVGAPAAAPPATQISEIPDKFVIPEPQKDYLKRIEMIPMRDGEALHRHHRAEGCQGRPDRPDTHAEQRPEACLE
jgi:hypothetical protein